MSLDIDNGLTKIHMILETSYKNEAEFLLMPIPVQEWMSEISNYTNGS